jgi:hypothetical protein
MARRVKAWRAGCRRADAHSTWHASIGSVIESSCLDATPTVPAPFTLFPIVFTLSLKLHYLAQARCEHTLLLASEMAPECTWSTSLLPISCHCHAVLRPTRCARLCTRLGAISQAQGICGSGRTRLASQAWPSSWARTRPTMCREASIYRTVNLPTLSYSLNTAQSYCHHTVRTVPHKKQRDPGRALAASSS